VTLMLRRFQKLIKPPFWFNSTYRWAGKMLVDAARLRNQERVAGRLPRAIGRGAVRMMQYLLSRDSRSVLKRLSGEKTVCAFDFDGTLAPIVAHPDVARMRDRTRSLLEKRKPAVESSKPPEVCSMFVSSEGNRS